MRYAICLLALTLIVVPTVRVEASTSNVESRQYYSNGKTVGQWHYYPEQKAYGIYYKYKPTVNYSGYKHHVAYYYPSRPKYVYYYNPETQKYWGRCPWKPTVTEPYQILDYSNRVGGDPLKIPEENFKPLPSVVQDPDKGKQTVTGPMPPIPGTDDNEQMAPPPPPPMD